MEGNARNQLQVPDCFADGTEPQRLADVISLVMARHLPKTATWLQLVATITVEQSLR